MRGIEQQFLALQKGLLELVPPQLLRPFDERELELVICGLGTIDINDWKANTRLKVRQTLALIEYKLPSSLSENTYFSSFCLHSSIVLLILLLCGGFGKSLSHTVKKCVRAFCSL